jgi:hypothetical protein
MKALMIAIALVLVAGIAHADSSGEIHGCYKKQGGDLRISERCTRGEIAITWNQQGPAGPVGPVGPAASFTVLQDKVWSDSTETSHTITCPDAMSVLAGEAWITLTTDDGTNRAGDYALPTHLMSSKVEIDLHEWDWVSHNQPTFLSWYVTCGTI